MECICCQGLMAEDHFFGFEGTQVFMWIMWMKGWRCLNCGHAVDPLIAANRRLHEASVVVRPSEELENEKEHVYLRAETFMRVAV